MTNWIVLALGLTSILALYPQSTHASLAYQRPSPQLEALATAELAPRVLADSSGKVLLLLSQHRYPSIQDLSEPELRLAGVRVNPQKSIGSRVRYFHNIQLRYLNASYGNAKANNNRNAPATVPVTGLPVAAKIAYVTWSPDETKVAFTHTNAQGVALWMIDIATAEARSLVPESDLNAVLGRPFVWAADSQSLLVKRLPKARAKLIDTTQAVPTGPTVSDSFGAKAQNRTYQDLLKTPIDAFNFELLATSTISRVMTNGTQFDFLPAALYQSMQFSPNGVYLLISKVKRPFSYLVPYYRFAAETEIRNADGGIVTQLIDRPVEEVRPKGFMATTQEKRQFQWRADAPASVTWIQALDKGDPAIDVPYRDALFELSAPFTDGARKLIATQNRMRGIHWGNNDIAIAEDYWFNTRNTKSYRFAPSDPSLEPAILFDRNYQDRYQDPGAWVKVRDERHQSVLALAEGAALLFGEGYTELGQFPFVSTIDLDSGTTQDIYRSRYTDQVERFLAPIDQTGRRILVRIESPSAYPNYFIRDLQDNSLTKITDFDNPFAALNDVSKRILNYSRADDLPLSGTLYLPAQYDPASDERLPLLLWAYPVEYKDANSAGQTTANANEFTYPYYGSPIFWVTQGFAVLDDAAFPIIGAGDSEPNDSFRSQLVANAKAAIDHLDGMGVIDPTRVAVGGHSYGAFMVANLLSHTDLFAAGIARSGAYNRTLTPFGFQREERSYWEAPEVYNNLSPFMHADKMRTPLLLIHGEADNNSGTYPMQSERYFNALKGLGGPARLVMLPKESHGYRAKESVLHMLWEQDQWLRKHVLKPAITSRPAL